MAQRFGTVFSRRNRARLFFVLILSFWLVPGISIAKQPPDIAGDWAGALQVQGGRVTLHLILHVTADSAGKLSVTLDSLDQNAMGLGGSAAVLKGDNFSFDIPLVSGSYSGTLSTDARSMSGTWTQGSSLPLIFSRVASSSTIHKATDVVGDWFGALPVGGSSLRLALHIKADDAGHLRGTFDSLDQKALGIAVTDAMLKGDTFSCKIPSISATYTGTLGDDGKGMNGTWSQGVPTALYFSRYTGGPTPTAMPTPKPAPAQPPVALSDLKPILDHELAPVLEQGLLSKASGGGGVVIGVMQHGKRRVFAYGAAKPDSIFEIGSISKTFTGIILAQMVVQKKVTLDEPIRALLPAGFAAKPAGAEITLIDLATQHSGLPRMPDNFKPKDLANPYVDYGAPQLREFITRHGVEKPADAAFLYSHLGFGLLGYGLSQRAGVPYGQLLSSEIAGPLRMSDTGVTLSPAQRARLIQGYDSNFDPTPAWDFDVFAGAGAIRSTAADMLTYLDGNLHPDKYATGSAADSPAATFPAAIALDHQVRAKIGGDSKIALAWFFDPKTNSYSHSGGTGGYTSMCMFNSSRDLGIVVLYNRDNNDFTAPRFRRAHGRKRLRSDVGKTGDPGGFHFGR
jgi:serine-type D-Ala-D-Ala carboxypeptidase/endopeptidase